MKKIREKEKPGKKKKTEEKTKPLEGKEVKKQLTENKKAIRVILLTNLIRKNKKKVII